MTSVTPHQDSQEFSICLAVTKKAWTPIREPSIWSQ